jgi:glutamate-1-semialdehyde 2,1-aminomutase
MGALVDGISSSARVLPPLDGKPLEIVRSEGAYLYGDDGRRYVDTAVALGGTILGHAHPEVVEAVSTALRNGPLPGFSHAGEESAASALVARTGALDRVIFNNSGSEAVHLAARIARVVTGRARVAKMAAGFDGWLDEMAFGNVTSAEASFADARPSNGGVTLLRFNDFDDVERLFTENDDIAAVIYEPMLANAACLAPSPGYLEHVEKVARAHGALLIADEVLMGFRLHAGLSSHAMGLDPDLATVGKAIGSGIAVAGVIGRAAVMECYHRAKGLRGGTFSGNPLAAAAVQATLRVLSTADYPALQARGDALRQHIAESFASAGLAVSTSGYGDVFGLWFASEAPRDYATALALADPAKSLRLHIELRRAGLLALPSPYGRHYVTFAHDEEALEIAREAFEQAANAMTAQP